MWRSRGLSRLAGAGVSKFLSAPNAPIPQPVLRNYNLSSFSSIPKTPFPRNPRYFSQDSADPIPDTDPKPKPPSLYDFIMEDIGPLSDPDTDIEDMESSENSSSENGVEMIKIPEGMDMETVEKVKSVLSFGGEIIYKTVEEQLREATFESYEPKWEHFKQGK